MRHSPAALHSCCSSSASRLVAAMALLPAGLGFVGAASAATLYWDGNSSGAVGNPPTSGVGGAGTWSSAGNQWWNGSTYQTWNAAGGQDVADFRGTGSITVTVSGTVNVNRINQAVNSNTFAGGTINFSSGGVWEFNNTQGTIVNSALSGGLTINATGSALNLSSSASVVLGGTNTGLANLDVVLPLDSNIITAVGNSSLGGASTTAKLTKGIVNLGNTSNVDATLALGSLNLAGGTLRGRFGVYSIGAATSLSADSQIMTRNASGVGVIFSTGSTINLNNRTLSLMPSSLSSGIVINGVISGSGNITLLSNTLGGGDNGSGTLMIGGNNTFTGQVTLNSPGTVVIASGGAINSSSGVVVNAGTFRYDNTAAALAAPVILNSGTLTGTGAVTLGAVTVSNNSSAIITNNNGVAGTGLAVGNLTFNGAARINLNIDGAVSSPSSSPITLIAAGALSTNAAGSVLIAPSTSTGLWTTGSVYNLLSYTGGSIGGAGFGQFTLNALSGLTSRQSSVFSNTGSAITLAINGDNPYWVGGTNGDWNTTQTGNWKLVGSGADTTFIQGDEVHFTDGVGGGVTNVNITANAATAAVLFNNSSTDYTISSSGGFGITSAVNVTKTGTGTVTISSNNTYSGGTAVNAGTLRVQGGGAIGDSSVVTLANAASATLDVQSSETIAGLSGGGSSGGTVSIASGQTLTLSGATAQTYAGTISGQGNLALSGSANHTLTGLPSHTGTTSIASGARLAVNRSDSVNFNSELNGSGTFAVVGTGTVVLGASSTFNGTVSLANTAGTTLSLNNINQSFGAITGGGTTGGTIAIGSANLTLRASSNQTYTGFLSGSGNLIVNASNPLATVSFGGTDTAASTAFTGNTYVQSGIFILGRTHNILGANSSGLGNQAVFVSNGATVRLNYANAAYTQFQNYVLNGTGADGNGALQALGINFGSGAQIGGIVAESDSLVRVTRDNSASSQTLQVRNALAGSGNLTIDGGAGARPGITLLTVGSSNLTLGGNTYQAYSGNLALTGNSTLIAGAANALGNAKLVTLNTGTTLQINTGNQTVGGLSGAGGVVFNGNSTLTLGANDLSASFSGVASSNSTVMGSIAKIGLGTQTLSGANTYTGTTTVSGGTLLVDTTGSLANTSGITVASGATFTYNSSSALTKAIAVTEGASIGGTGVLTAANLTFNADLGNGLSSVSLGSAFAKGGELSLSLTGITDGTYTLFSGTSIGGSFTGVRLNGTLLDGSGNVFSGMVNSISYTYTDNLNQLVVSAIPEPSSFAVLVGFGALGAVGLRRRRR